MFKELTFWKKQMDPIPKTTRYCKLSGIPSPFPQYTVVSSVFEVTTLLLHLEPPPWWDVSPRCHCIKLKGLISFAPQAHPSIWGASWFPNRNVFDYLCFVCIRYRETIHSGIRQKTKGLLSVMASFCSLVTLVVAFQKKGSLYINEKSWKIMNFLRFLSYPNYPTPFQHVLSWKSARLQP